MSSKEFKDRIQKQEKLANQREASRADILQKRDNQVDFILSQVDETIKNDPRYQELILTVFDSKLMEAMVEYSRLSKLKTKTYVYKRNWRGKAVLQGEEEVEIYSSVNIFCQSSYKRTSLKTPPSNIFSQDLVKSWYFEELSQTGQDILETNQLQQLIEHLVERWTRYVQFIIEIGHPEHDNDGGIVYLYSNFVFFWRASDVDKLLRSARQQKYEVGNPSLIELPSPKRVGLVIYPVGSNGCLSSFSEDERSEDGFRSLDQLLDHIAFLFMINSKK